MEDIGPRIRDLRERAVLSQGELAVKVGISQNALSQIETGRSQPRMSTIRKVAEALGIEPARLMQDPYEERGAP
jgi:transcriptional regulator with XRE-family HTH domain